MELKLSKREGFEEEIAETCFMFLVSFDLICLWREEGERTMKYIWYLAYGMKQSTFSNWFL
jgi:hypothetical protein